MEKQESSIVIYTTEDGSTNLQVKMENETVWLTQSQMAELFHKDQSVIARHISNVFKEGELEKGSNMQILHNTLSKYKCISTVGFCQTAQHFNCRGLSRTVHTQKSKQLSIYDVKVKRGHRCCIFKLL